MMDLVSQPQGSRKDQRANLKDFNIDLYRAIVLYKTAFYTFYLPFACGLIITGYSSTTQLAAAKRICMALGEKFQIEDDYLDCYGLPEVIGKVGTDIQDHKCSWLLVQALDRVTEGQRAVIEKHYGEEEESSVEEIKKLYRELNLTKVYEEQEERSYAEIVAMFEEYKGVLPTTIFAGILEKIHFRKK